MRLALHSDTMFLTIFGSIPTKDRTNPKEGPSARDIGGIQGVLRGSVLAGGPVYLSDIWAIVQLLVSPLKTE